MTTGSSIVRSRDRLFAAFLLVPLSLALLVQGAWADLTGPTPEDREVTLAVVTMLKRGHMSRHPLDDEISRRCLGNFLKRLDPMKMYFYQSDVDAFAQWEDRLDDRVQQGDVSFAYEVFNVYLDRVDERLRMVDELLAREHDFTVDEEIASDRDMLNYPKNEAEAFDRWRKRIKYDLLLQKIEETEAQEGIERLSRRYRSLAKRKHQTDREELLEQYLSALTMAYDPHTTYMSPKTVENFKIMMGLHLEGIGAALQFDDGYTVVKKIIKGGAADKDGQLKLEDRIVAVAQGAADSGEEWVDVIDMKLSDVVQLIRGKRRTIVRLKVIPDGENAPKVYKITRDKIELKDSEARPQIVDVGQKTDSQPYRVGVIDLPSFYMDMQAAQRNLPNYKSTTRDVHRILDDFREKGVDAVVMDLRYNGGGSLTEAIKLTGLFIDRGPVVQVKDADGDVQHYDDLDRGTAWAGPLVVLVSRFSASASEIFAGAIQDYQRGLIVGDHTTHGKGTVQTLRDLGRELFLPVNAPKLGALKITMQKFYRPSGDSTQNRGVEADIELLSLTSHLENIGEADLDYAMEFDRVDRVPFNRLKIVNDAMVDALTRNSTQRQQESDDFQRLLEAIDRYELRKKRKAITLNEEEFMAERAALDAQKDEEKKVTNAGNGTRPVVDPDDFHMSETLAITADYLDLLSSSALPQGRPGAPALSIDRR